MKLTHLEQVLEKAGLSKYKRDAYLALIKLNSGTVVQIAKKSSVPTSKLYEIMAWLCEQGYATIVNTTPLTYRPNDPKSVLRSRVEKQQEELEELKKEIERIEQEAPTIARGQFNIIFGKKAFLTKVKEACRNTNKSIYGIFGHWRVDAELLKIEEELKTIDKKFLGPITKENKNKVRLRVERGAQVKHFQPDLMRFTVWDRKIVAISLREKENAEYYSIWVESETLGNIMAEHFLKLWKTAN